MVRVQKFGECVQSRFAFHLLLPSIGEFGEGQCPLGIFFVERTDYLVLLGQERAEITDRPKAHRVPSTGTGSLFNLGDCAAWKRLFPKRVLKFLEHGG